MQRIRLAYLNTKSVKVLFMSYKCIFRASSCSAGPSCSKVNAIHFIAKFDSSYFTHVINYALRDVSQTFISLFLALNRLSIDIIAEILKNPYLYMKMNGESKPLTFEAVGCEQVQSFIAIWSI